MCFCIMLDHTMSAAVDPKKGIVSRTSGNRNSGTLG